MFDNELVGKIATGLITAVVSVAICLINNAVTLKRDRLARDQKYLDDLNELKDEYTTQISAIKADFMAHLEELIATQQDLMNQISLIKHDYESMLKSIDRHNQVIERTYNLEKRMEVAEERQRVVNHRVDDLERKA